MDKQMKTRLARALAMNAEAFNRELTDATFALWEQALESSEPEIVIAGLERHAMTGRFFPTPGEIMGDGNDDANAAWLAVLEYCRNRTKIPDSAAVRNAVSVCGGLNVIGHTATDQLGFMQKRFMDAYREFQPRDEPEKINHEGLEQLQHLAKGVLK